MESPKEVVVLPFRFITLHRTFDTRHFRLPSPSPQPPLPTVRRHAVNETRDPFTLAGRDFPRDTSLYKAPRRVAGMSRLRPFAETEVGLVE